MVEVRIPTNTPSSCSPQHTTERQQASTTLDTNPVDGDTEPDLGTDSDPEYLVQSAESGEDSQDSDEYEGDGDPSDDFRECGRIDTGSKAAVQNSDSDCDSVSDSDSEISDIEDGCDITAASDLPFEKATPSAQSYLDKMPRAFHNKLSEMLFSLCISAITADTWQKDGDHFACSLVGFAAVLGVRADGVSFREPYNYTSHLAGMMWVARMLLLEVSLPLRAYKHVGGFVSRSKHRNQAKRALAVHSAFGVQDTFYPLSALIRWLRSGLVLSRFTTHSGTVQWSIDSQTIYWRNSDAGISMRRFCSWVQHVLKIATEGLHRELLLGLQDNTQVTDLTDMPVCQEANFSFLDIESNSVRPSCRALLPLCEHPPQGLLPLVENGRWDRSRALDYVKKASKWLGNLMLLIQLTWGQPARQSEVLSIKWRNTTSSNRNLYIHQGRMLLICEYHKCRSRNERDYWIPRFVPQPVGRLIVLYLRHVRPLVQQLQRTFGKKTVQERIDSPYLFALPGYALPRSGFLSDRLRESSIGFFMPFRFTVQSYRHVAIGITKKHLQCEVSMTDQLLAAQFISNIFAAQAGHRAHLFRQIYGVESAGALTGIVGQLDAYCRASSSWHDFVLQFMPHVDAPHPAAQQQLLAVCPHDRRQLPWPFLAYYKKWKMIVCGICRTALAKDSYIRHIKLHCPSDTISSEERFLLDSLDVWSIPRIMDRIRSAGCVAPFPELFEPQLCTKCLYGGCGTINNSNDGRRKHLRTKHKILPKDGLDHKVEVLVQYLMPNHMYTVEVDTTLNKVAQDS